MVIPLGAFVVVYGPQGAGKSALLRSIAGLGGCRPHFDVKISLDGRSLDSIPSRILRSEMIYVDVSMVEAIGSFKIKKAVKSLVGFNLRDLTKDTFEAINALDLHSLVEKPRTSLKDLSFSQRILFLTLMTLVRPAKILIFDDVIDHVDDERLNGLIEILKDRTMEGKTVILSTRYERRLLRFADIFIFLKDGKIVFEGKPKDYAMASH